MSRGGTTTRRCLQRDVERRRIVERLLHRVTNAVGVVLRFNQRQRNIRLDVKDVVGSYALAQKTQEERAKAKAKESPAEKRDDVDKDDRPDEPHGKVYTNSDLGAVRPAPAAARAATKATRDLVTGKGTESEKGEAYWRARVAPLKKKIHDNIVNELALKRRIDNLTYELSGIGALNTRRAGVETERQRLITEREALLQKTVR